MLRITKESIDSILQAINLCGFLVKSAITVITYSVWETKVH
jgi:hypothetical protein